MARILILGGGFGGLAAAHELRRRLPQEHTVAVVDRRQRFFVGYAKLWDLAGLRPLEEGSRPLERLAARGIDFLHAEILEVDPRRRAVRTRDGTLEGDFLVVALGAAFEEDRVSNFRQAGYNLYDAHALPAMHHALEHLEEGRLVIAILGLPYKCPPAPYEAAFLLDEWLRRQGRRPAVEMHIFTPQPSPLPIAGPEASARVARTLEEREIWLHPSHQASGADPGVRVLNFAGGQEIRFSVLLGVPGHVLPPVLRSSGLAGPSGWVEPDRRTLRTAFDRVYAVGDCTLLPIAGGQLPKAGVFAEAQGLVAAANILAELGLGEEAAFEGRGHCFLEFAQGQAAYVEGDFFAEPKPRVTVSSPDEKTFKEKQGFERERLQAWL